jgi:DNA-binding MarR family transcriptional regulator
MDILKTQQLLERLASLLRTENRNLLLEHGLQPVQFEALQYLSVCNRYSDTLMGVTEYLGQTKGSVSQSLKVLEKKGLLEKSPDQVDKRVVHMTVTMVGHKLVKHMPSSALLKAAKKQLNETEIASAETSLQSLLKSIQHANNFKTFGQCATCSHNIKYSVNETICGLTKEALSIKDVELICREHKPKDSIQPFPEASVD